MKPLLTILLLILLITTNPPALSADPVDASIIDLANKERVNRGLEPLVFNERLQKAVRLRAEQIHGFDRLSHQGFLEAVKKAGFNPHDYYGENLALGLTNDQVVGAWRDSPSHAKILFNRCNQVGLGQVEDLVVMWVACE